MVVSSYAQHLPILITEVVDDCDCSTASDKMGNGRGTAPEKHTVQHRRDEPSRESGLQAGNSSSVLIHYLPLALFATADPP